MDGGHSTRPERFRMSDQNTHAGLVDRQFGSRAAARAGGEPRSGEIRRRILYRA
jgi:hypothetical protein